MRQTSTLITKIYFDKECSYITGRKTVSVLVTPGIN